MNTSAASSYDYVAYIDEAGDDGLRLVKPVDQNGSSEWLILSAAVIRASYEKEFIENMSDLTKKVTRQASNIHFARLSPRRKILVCENTAQVNARYFVVASNKKNMRGYRNRKAEKIPSSNWFYCWLSRMLLERVTDFIRVRSLEDYSEPRSVRLEFSQRGGLRYSQMSAYYDWLKLQGEKTYLRGGYVDFSVIRRQLMFIYRHHERAGLQYADVVASAFFKACDKFDTGSCHPQFAKALKPRMARSPDNLSGRISGHGVKLIPSLKRAQLDEDQAEIFTHYGYPSEWWDPGAVSTQPF